MGFHSKELEVPRVAYRGLTSVDAACEVCRKLLRQIGLHLWSEEQVRRRRLWCLDHIQPNVQTLGMGRRNRR